MDLLQRLAPAPTVPAVTVKVHNSSARPVEIAVRGDFFLWWPGPDAPHEIGKYELRGTDESSFERGVVTVGPLESRAFMAHVMNQRRYAALLDRGNCDISFMVHYATGGHRTTNDVAFTRDAIGKYFVEVDVGAERGVVEGSGPLKIDDVIVRDGPAHVVLDVRIRNSGEVPANVTRAELRILSRVPYAAAYKPSASYDLFVEGNRCATAVAHVLQPGEVDRFELRVGFSKYNTSCGFEAELILVYNGSQRVVSQPFRFDSAF